MDATNIKNKIIIIHLVIKSAVLIMKIENWSNENFGKVGGGFNSSSLMYLACMQVFSTRPIVSHFLKIVQIKTCSTLKCVVL